jgi:hypothetical protein
VCREHHEYSSATMCPCTDRRAHHPDGPARRHPRPRARSPSRQRRRRSGQTARQD